MVAVMCVMAVASYPGCKHTCTATELLVDATAVLSACKSALPRGLGSMVRRGLRPRITGAEPVPTFHCNSRSKTTVIFHPVVASPTSDWSLLDDVPLRRGTGRDHAWRSAGVVVRRAMYYLRHFRRSTWETGKHF